MLFRVIWPTKELCESDSYSLFLTESIRVVEFRQAAVCTKSVSDLSKLMRESHRSLLEKYECSHANLDKLVEISDQFGVGARLTGAGYVIWMQCMGVQRFDNSNFAAGADASLPFVIHWSKVRVTSRN